MISSTFKTPVVVTIIKHLRTFHTNTQCCYKVAVLGGAGGVGQPLALLLKHSPLVTQLAIYDVATHTHGVVKDLSHVDTLGVISSFTETNELYECLRGCSLVIMTAGIPSKSEISTDEIFNSNARIAMELADACAQNCHNAMLAIITNPVNSIVPIASEVYMRRGVYNPAKIIGVTTLSVVRANTFLSQAKHFDVLKTNVPVIGGHSEQTILPLLSQAIPHTHLTQTEILTLTKHIQDAEGSVIKCEKESATLSMAYAGARFGLSILQGLHGMKGLIECAFVASDVAIGIPYFARPILLGRHGKRLNLGLGKLSQFERLKLKFEVLPGLRGDIAKGRQYVKGMFYK